jgi:threonine aldolase
MAALMGKEAAMYLPSGTMCNVVAILTHCQRGDEVVAHETSHILHSEGGAHAALTGVQIMPMRGPKGMFTADDLRGADIRPKPLHPAAAAFGSGANRQYRWRRRLAAGAA